MIKKEALVIDFDHTLFNTTAYVLALKKVLAGHDISAELFDAKRQYLKDCLQWIS